MAAGRRDSQAQERTDPGSPRVCHSKAAVLLEQSLVAARRHRERKYWQYWRSSARVGASDVWTGGRWASCGCWQGEYGTL
jgi:hypothetical protein